MNQTCENAKELLSGILSDAGFDLSVESEWTDEGCVLNLTGEDTHYALAEKGELLDAFEVVLFQAMGRELDREHRFIVDADGFRQTRKNELHAMARFAAEQVRKTGRSFTFGVLNCRRRPRPPPPSPPAIDSCGTRTPSSASCQNLGAIATSVLRFHIPRS